MHCRTAQRAIRLAATIAVFTGGWTGTRAATAADPPPTAGATPAATAESPTPDAAMQAANSACQKTLAVLIGKKDSDVLASRDVQTLGTQMPDLVTCGAVLRNSDAACKHFMPMEHGPGMMCAHMRSIFNELRVYPKGRSFMVDDVDFEQDCNGIPVLKASCEPMRAALRAGDAAKCAQAGDLESFCRAYITGDPSLCKLSGKAASAEITLPDPKAGAPASYKIKDPLEARCRETIESRGFLAKGLKEIAQSGPPRERELAKAALGEPDACATFMQRGVQVCAAMRTTPAATVASTPPRKPPDEP